VERVPLVTDYDESVRDASAFGVALFQGQYFTNNALLMAAANMATIPVLVLFLVFQRQLVEGITLSGLK